MRYWLGVGLGLLLGSGVAQADDRVARGKYLATAGDCVACHTAPGGADYAGGLMMNTPFGPISTPNITPDKATGIGNMTDAQFLRVFHQGIGQQGEYLYPVMPYPWYARVTNDDALAIKAYLFSMKPVHAPRKPSHMAFPFNIRASLSGWDLLFLKDRVFKPDPHQNAAWNRGAYLVTGLAHCGECHNGNDLFGNTAIAQPLRGGVIDNWYAPNITSDKAEGIGRFSSDQLFSYLKTGTAPGMGVVAGPMAQTIHESLSKLTDDDLRAIVLYIKATKPAEEFKRREPVAGSPQVAVNAQSYLNYCSSCHGQNGEGLADAVPKLAGSPTVQAGGPQDVVRVILGGLPAQGPYSAMPAIGVRMSDQEIADATNYVRQAWGNGAPTTAGPGMAGDLRKLTQTVLAANPIGGCPPAATTALGKISLAPATQAILRSTREENLLQNAQKLIAIMRKGAPKTTQADLINSLTNAYCPVVMANTHFATQAQKSEQIDEFAERLYTEYVAPSAEKPN